MKTLVTEIQSELDKLKVLKGFRYAVSAGISSQIVSVEYGDKNRYVIYGWPYGGEGGTAKQIARIAAKQIKMELRYNPVWFPWYDSPSLLSMPKDYICSVIDNRDAWNEIPEGMRKWLKERD